MPKPICVPCARFYRPKNNGIAWEEGRPLDNERTRWGPYKLWMGDLWSCPSCDHEIVVGHSNRPIAEHFEFDYERQRMLVEPKLRVDDC